ncbi:MAG: hypothetical protein GF355_00020 [Candidatus Eisenbacteria bacterium]|nr:hypothetical protein [Candidatus Eisenbacteria bacterium]
MSGRKVWILCCMIAGLALVAGPAGTAELPYEPWGGPGDQHGPDPGGGEGDGDADDLGIYMQPIDPEIDVIRDEDGSQELPPGQGQRDIERARRIFWDSFPWWLQDALRRWWL